MADERFHGLGEPAPVAVYLHLLQAPVFTGAGVLLVRTAGDPSSLTGSVPALIRARDPGLAIFGVETLDRTVSRSVAQQRFAMVLLSAFALSALALGVLGVYGVLNYEVTERRREIGIRTALGAAPAAVVRLIVRRGLALAALAVVIGAAGALLLSHLLGSLLFGVSSRDPLTLGVVIATLVVTSLVASALPAWRAARIHPATAIR